MELINDDKLMEITRNGELEDGLLASAPRVAVIYTQSWCPQWHAMRDYLQQPEFAERDDLDIYMAEYDKSGVFDEFRTFKETRWNNREVPYVRYYKDGKLTDTSNFVSKFIFADKLE